MQLAFKVANKRDVWFKVIGVIGRGPREKWTRYSHIERWDLRVPSSGSAQSVTVTKLDLEFSVVVVSLLWKTLVPLDTRL